MDGYGARPVPCVLPRLLGLLDRRVQVSDPLTDCIGKLRDSADELDSLSRALHKSERDLEPVEREYRAFVDDFEVGLWKQHQDDGAKLPSEALRVKLAERQMDPALLGRYVGLVMARRRAEKRIRDLRASVDAQRSILSALKSELEATR